MSDLVVWLVDLDIRRASRKMQESINPEDAARAILQALEAPVESVAPVFYDTEPYEP